MKTIEFEKLIYTDFHISDLIAIDKMVENNQTFYVYDDKRTTSVFVHLKDCAIKYVCEDGSVLNCEKGSIAYIPHTAKYSVTYLAKNRNYALAQLVAFELTDPERTRFTAADRIIKVCKAEDNIYQEPFDKAVAMCAESSFPYSSFKSFLYSLITDLSKSFNKSTSKKEDYILEPCIRYMKSCNYRSVTVTYLADLCHISESCFRRRFKAFFGVTPYDYIINQRIIKAKELLRNNRYTVNEVAELSGFTDSSYFSKAFKSACGVSPSKYRTSFIL